MVRSLSRWCASALIRSLRNHHKARVSPGPSAPRHPGFFSFFRAGFCSHQGGWPYSHQTGGVLIWRYDSRSVSRCGGGPSGGGSRSDRCGACGGAPGGPCMEASTGAPVLRQRTGRATGFSLSWESLCLRGLPCLPSAPASPGCPVSSHSCLRLGPLLGCCLSQT